MMTIADFIKIEGDEATRKILLNAIEKLSSTNVEEQEFTFNIFSVVLSPKENRATIFHDIDPDENPPAVFPLDEFYMALDK